MGIKVKVLYSIQRISLNVCEYERDLKCYGRSKVK